MKKRTYYIKDNRTAYLMIMPFFLFFTLFVVYPIGANFFYSFTNYDLSSSRAFTGLANYSALLRDGDFLRSVYNTALYALLSVVPLTLMGFAAAALVNSRLARRSNTAKAISVLFTFPYVTSMIAVSMIWLLLYEPTGGVFNKILMSAGISPQRWLFNENQALLCLVAMNIWKHIGYVMVIYLGGLQTIPRQLYESASIDGASDIKCFFKITVPMISHITFFINITLWIEAFKTFDQIRVMTGGGPVNSTTTIVHQIYISSFTEFKYGYASAMSVILFILTSVVILLNFKTAAGKRQLEQK
ncbi:MAG: sugar ABC transporter permease [Eubacteriales bacterium]|nr:sugar ABC transporter permease [Eubacteriales bacterium]